MLLKHEIDLLFENYLKSLHKAKVKQPLTFILGYFHCLDDLELSTSKTAKLRLELYNTKTQITTSFLLTKWYAIKEN